MKQHTAGPWKAEGPDPFGDYNIIPPGARLAVAAVVSNLRPADEVAANAILVESAPRLLKDIQGAWQTLEEHGFPPEAAGWPHVDLLGELPNAIDCAIDCLVRQREQLLKEVIELRKLKPTPPDSSPVARGQS